MWHDHNTWILSTWLCVAMISPASVASAQSFSDAQRKALYEQNKLELAPTVLSNLILPGWGNLKVNQPVLGLGCMALFVMSAFTLYFGSTRQDTTLMVFGGALLGTSYVTSTWTTYDGVLEHNETLRLRYGVPSMALAPKINPSHGLQVQLRF